MAQISGYTPGLAPQVVQAPPKPKPEAKKLEPQKCTACGGTLPEKASRGRHRTDEEGQCPHCSSFFGTGTSLFNRGCTDRSPEECTKRISEAKNAGWVMILRTQTLGGPGGVSVQLQMGDIVKVASAQPDPGEGPTQLDRTRGMFMIGVTVGPLNMSLYPHEFSAVPFATIMELKRENEIEEQFVSPDDETGYFAPTPRMREEIKAAFGNR